MLEDKIPKGETQTPKGDEATQTSQGTEGEATPEKTESKAEVTPAKEDVDYKKKFGESTAENQREKEKSAELSRKNEELEEQLAKANETPSEEELESKYPGWELKEEEEKERLRGDEGREKRLRKVEEKIAWDADFKSLVAKPEFASLKDKEEEFKTLAYKSPSTDILTLAKSFLYTPYDAKPKEEPKVEPRKGLETPSGGKSEIQEPGKLTLEDIKRLREEDPKTYLKMVQQGQLKDIPEE